MTSTLFRDMTFLLSRSVLGIAPSTRSFCLFCSRNPARLPGDVFRRRCALFLHERDEAGPVEDGRARPQMALQPVLVASHFSPAMGTVPLIHRLHPLHGSVVILVESR